MLLCILYVSCRHVSIAWFTQTQQAYLPAGWLDVEWCLQAVLMSWADTLCAGDSSVLL